MVDDGRLGGRQAGQQFENGEGGVGRDRDDIPRLVGRRGGYGKLDMVGNEEIDTVDFENVNMTGRE